MGYEDAPATKMVATQCAVCSRPLVDAKSVELGIGPDCRRKYGFDLAASEEARTNANQLVYRIACDQTGPEVATLCCQLKDIGFPVLADRILERVASVRIEARGEWLAVDTPYSPEVVEALRRVPGRKWDKEDKLNMFPAAQRQALWAALKSVLAGRVGLGPKGVFTI